MVVRDDRENREDRDKNTKLSKFAKLLKFANNQLSAQFVVRSVSSATLGKNSDDGLYSKYCSLLGFFLGDAIDHLSHQI